MRKLNKNMTLSGIHEFLPQERVIFGQPAAGAVLAEAERRGAGRVFVVASGTLSRRTGVVEGIKKALGARFAGLYDVTVAHTPRPSVIAAARAAREVGPDLIVSVGGGTVIDTVKVLLMCLAEGVDESDGLEDLRVKVAADGSRQVPEIALPPCRQIAVPTTLSAAEFSNIAGCTNPERGIKEHFTAPTIGPAAVILDPAVCLHTPDWLWLSTGIRAVDHAVEGICSAQPQPFADAVSLHALRLFASALPANLAVPDDLEARLQSQIAAWLAGSSIGKVPYGASHGIGHQLGAVAGVPHGHTSCVLLPAVLDYNLEVTKEAQTQVSQAMGRPGEPAAKTVGDFIAGLGLPRSLREVGVERGQLSTIAEGSLENPWVRGNPRPIDHAEQVMEILENAW